MRATKLMGLMVGVLVASSTFADAAARTPQESALLDQVAIPADYQVTFEDPRGRPIQFVQFKAQMTRRPFDIIKDTNRHQATLKLKSDEAIARSRAGSAHAATLPILGHSFPAFHAMTLEGAKVSLASLRGRPFIANFFFALCAPCIAETPVLSRFHEAHPDIPVVAFTFDDAATAREFARTRHFNWPVVAGQEALAEQAGVDVYPTLVLVNAQGIVTKAAHSGAIAKRGKPLVIADLERWVEPISH